MTDLKPGEFIVLAGDFQAELRLTPGPPGSKRTPSFRVGFRIASDPSNLDGLTEVRNKAKVGNIWKAESGRIGWSVSRADELESLSNSLANVPSRLPRRELVDTWRQCVRMLPSLLRRELEAKGRTYVREDWMQERENLVLYLGQLAVKHPLAHRVLPPNYFSLWA